jgi:hypothetical protein
MAAGRSKTPRGCMNSALLSYMPKRILASVSCVAVLKGMDATAEYPYAVTACLSYGSLVRAR